MPDDLKLDNNTNQNAGSQDSAMPADGLSSSPEKSPLEEATGAPNGSVMPDSAGGMASPTQDSAATPDLDQMPTTPPEGAPIPEAPSTPEPPAVETSNPPMSEPSIPEPTTPEPPAPEMPANEAPASELSMPEPNPSADMMPEQPVNEPAAPTPTPEAPAMSQADEPAKTDESSSPMAEPSPIDKPADQGEPGEPAPAPDTDEFLKNILATPDSQKPEEKAPVQDETAPQNQTSPTVPSLGAAPQSESPDQSSQPNMAESQGMAGQSSGGFGGSSMPPVDSVGVPSPSPDQSNNVSNDVVGAMQKNQPEGKQKSKLVILIIIALIIIIGGYLAYTKLLNPSAPVATEDTTMVSTTPVNVSNDQVRKQDLKTIQQALLNLYASENKYPVSTETIFLTGTSNVVAKALTNNLATIPVDPDPQKNYAYKSDGSTFTLTAVLDDTSDPDGVLENGLYLMKVTPTTVIKLSNTSINEPADPTSGSSDLTGALPSVTTN